MAGVAGTDGEVPVYSPDEGFRIWNLKQVYTGNEGKGRFVPKVDDLVIDLTTFDWYIVVSRDDTTMIPFLNPIRGSLPNQIISPDDRLLGMGPGTVSDTYRVYVDTSVMPHTMSVDARLRFHGTMASNVKIFRGSDLTGNSKVVSAIYSPSGTLIGQSIPLELVAMPSGINKATKSIPTCYTTEDLPDGEVLTIVAYSDDGHVVMKCQILVENTAFIATSDSSAKYITRISMESPFITDSDPRLIQYPLNVPLAGLSLTGLVHYNDGSIIRMPVDNTKFSIFGFNNFAATIPGQTFKLVLSYKLSSNEIVYGATVGESKQLQQTYDARTLNKEGMFTPKLYAYPVWQDALNGYRLEWFIYDLDRKISSVVTPFVRINTNSPAFDPIGYGRKQSLSVSINLRDVYPSGLSYMHVQTIDIILRQQGTERRTNWAVGFDPGQTVFFGEDNFASTDFVNANMTVINVSSGETNLALWLERMYYMTKPLSDSEKEGKAPMPDYFSVGGTNWESAYPISQWNQDLTINRAIKNSSTVFIKFFQRTPDTDIQLSVAGVPVYQND